MHKHGEPNNERTIESRLYKRPGHMQYTHAITIQPWHERWEVSLGDNTRAQVTHHRTGFYKAQNYQEHTHIASDRRRHTRLYTRGIGNTCSYQEKLMQKKYTTTHHHLIKHHGRDTQLANTIESRLHERSGHMHYTHANTIQPWHERWEVSLSCYGRFGVSQYASHFMYTDSQNNKLVRDTYGNLLDISKGLIKDETTKMHLKSNRMKCTCNA